LPYDIVQICLNSKDKNIILGALNEIALQRSKRSPILSEIEREIRIRESDLDFSIQKLCDANVLLKEGKNHVSLTDPGLILAKYSARKHYNEKCKQLLRNIDINETYWAYQNQQINYDIVVDTYLSWRINRDLP